MMGRKTLNSQSADSQPLTTTCYVLSSLEQEVEYWAEVRALDGGTGVPARTIFHTRLDGKFHSYFMPDILKMTTSHLGTPCGKS